MLYERPKPSGEKGIKPEDYLPFAAAQDHWNARQHAHIGPITQIVHELLQREFIPGKAVRPLEPARLFARDAIKYEFPGNDITKWVREPEPRIGWILNAVVQPLRLSHNQERRPLLLLDDMRCAVVSHHVMQQWETMKVPEFYIPADALQPLTVETPARLDLVHTQMQAIAERAR